MLTVLQSSACLPLVFPLRGGFCSLFYLVIKKPDISAFESSTSSLGQNSEFISHKSEKMSELSSVLEIEFI